MRPIRFIGLIGLTSLIGFIAPVARATDYSSANFKVNNPVINELGAFSTSASFQLRGNMPYIEPRRSTSTSYANFPDFLGSPSSSVVTTNNNPPSAFNGGPFVGPLKPKPEPGEPIRKRVDFNHDGRVDFIDFSILLYYYDKQGAIIVPFDLNDDGVVDVVDISIFMYYWDGN